MRRVSLIEDLWKDVGHAARVLRRSPGFTAIAVLTLALGIGANTAIFSVVYGVLLKPLPFHDPERLVGVWHRAPGLNLPVFQQDAATYFTYRESGRVFEDIGLWDAEQVSITESGEPERVQALRVTEGLLPVLRVQALLGRAFTKEDDAPGSPLRVILTYWYWQRRFGGTPDVVGQSVNVDGLPHEVIGVLPRSFTFLRTDAAVVLPFQLNRAEVVIGNFGYQALARLKPGVTVEQANADVARMIPLVVDRFPLPPGATRKMFDEVRLGPNVHPLSQDVIGDVDRVLWILFATVGMVLLIACANVANLFLVRIEGRQQELAIRAALGASWSRVARELLSESVGLALAGGGLGLLFAFAGIGLLARMAPAGLPRIDEIGINPAVLLFTLAISVLTGLSFGLIPVMRSGTPNVAALKEGGRSASDAPGRHRARNALVVSEVALALVLLIVSGLMIRTFMALRQVDPGFVRPEEVQTFRVSIPEALVEDPQQAARTHEQISQELEHVPGVVSVGVSSAVTMDGTRANGALFVEGFPQASGGLPPFRRHKRIAPGYFETMGNPVVAGRAITWTDIHRASPVVVISENLAREYWKDPAEAIGKRIREGTESPWREIIGVVGNERDDGLSQAAPAIVYWPMLMREFANDAISMTRNMAYVVRSDRMGSPSFLRELQQAVWSVNPNLPLANVRTLDEIQANSMAQTSFAMVMLAIAASVALLLGIVGIYGVIAYIATQRTREIGIRMALGAQTGNVRRLFLRHGLLLIGTGIALGTGVALALTRVMSALLFGVSPMDPVTYVAVAASLTAVALLATYLPARRASRIDPIIALRSDM
ncbi:MAG: FtsX-like permease family protein [Luteitalea sp.]|nr:FtsX-like permease family protein [Luteitalea sp.]